MRAKPRRLRCWRAWPMLWARPSQRVSSRCAVDGLGVVAARVEPFEVGVAGRDGPEVLGAVELAGGVVVVAVEPDGDGPGAVGGRGAGSRCTSGSGRSCRRLRWVRMRGSSVKVSSPVSVSSPMPSAPPCAKRRSVRRGAVGEGDGLVFDVGALLDASPPLRRGFLVGGLGGGDPVDGEQAEVAEQRAGGGRRAGRCRR